MNKTIIILIAILALSCSQEKPLTKELEKTHREKLNLNGNVKSLETYSIINGSKNLIEKYAFNEVGNYLTVIMLNNATEFGSGGITAKNKYTYTRIYYAYMVM